MDSVFNNVLLWISCRNFIKFRLILCTLNVRNLFCNFEAAKCIRYVSLLCCYDPHNVLKAVNVQFSHHSAFARQSFTAGWATSKNSIASISVPWPSPPPARVFNLRPTTLYNRSKLPPFSNPTCIFSCTITISRISCKVLLETSVVFVDHSCNHNAASAAIIVCV